MSNYKRQTNRANIDFQKLAQAIKAVKVKNICVATAAKMFKIPRSSFNRYLRKIEEEEENIDFTTIKNDVLANLLMRKVSYKRLSAEKMVFTASQENALVQYIKQCADYYYGVSIKDLKRIAYEYAAKLGVEYPKEWGDNKSAGRKWYRKFMIRHTELSLRTPEHTSMHRVKAFCKENVDNFFDQLSKVMDIGFDPMNIYNMDETGFPTVPTRVDKVIAQKGQKRIGQIASAERGSNISMALTVNAAGNSIPPMFLFPFKNMQSVFMDNCTPGAIGFANGGWMTQDVFIHYMRHFIEHTHTSVDNPTLLLLDNHTSHLSIEALDLAAENGVHMVTFPPHCTHRMQPLDVSVFSPVKNVYHSMVKAWHQNNANKIFGVRHVVGLVKDVLDTVLLPKTIKSGFAASGICPLNRYVFTESDFIAAELCGEAEVVESIGPDEQIIGFLNDLPVGENDALSYEPSTSDSVETANPKYTEILKEIGPLQKGQPSPKSKRGRKPMKSSILTSKEYIADLKNRKRAREEKQSKSKAKTLKTTIKKQEPKQQTNLKEKHKPIEKHETSSDEDEDFCIICLKTMSSKLAKSDMIACHDCKREVHVKCVKLIGPWYICPNCDSDDSA